MMYYYYFTNSPHEYITNIFANDIQTQTIKYQKRRKMLYNLIDVGCRIVTFIAFR